MEAGDKELEKLMRLPEWATQFLKSQPETGMQFQTGNVLLKNGSIFKDVVFLGYTFISEVKEFDKVPFHPQDIKKIELTHKKWQFR